MRAIETDRWRQVEEVLDAALDVREPIERALLLERACTNDADLRAEVESLLAHQAQSEKFIETPAFALAAELLADDENDELENRHIGAYKIIREVGRGGMGAVYLAERADGEFQQQVALKVVRRSFADTELARRFRRERQILASLNHPNIARLLDGGVSSDGEPYLVMEYVEGARIDDYCVAQNLSLRSRLGLFLAVCRGVAYAHQHLVVHRDLKPSNILVTEDGVPKLLDFGIAKLLDPEQAGGGDETRTGMRAFTPDYASPEQISGAPITTASDVYSLGILLDDLLRTSRAGRGARRSPGDWRTRSAGGTIATNLPTDGEDRNGGPKSSTQSFVNPELKNIVAMARREDPARRYASAAQFAEDVQRYLEGLPVRAQKDSFRYRAGKFVQRNKIPVFAALLIVLSLVAGLAAALWQADAARRERDVANAERLKATRINEFLQQMLSFSNQSVYSVAPVAQTKNVTVNQMLDEIEPRIEAELADQPEVRAQILRTIASAYASQGIYDKAEKNYRSALETQTRIFGTDHAETAATMTQFGVLAFRQGKIAEADQLLENAVAFYRRQQARQAPEFSAANLVTAMNFLGAVKMTSIDLQSSAAILEEALQIAENADLQGNERFALAAVQGDVGLYLARVGEHERADRLLRESLAIHRQLSQYPRWEMGATLASLGELYNRKNQPDQALEFLLESERIYRRTIGDKSRYLGFNLQHQAIALSLQKNFTAAEPKARQQLAIYLEAMPENKLVAAIPNSVLGIVLVGNKRFDEAEDYLREGLQGLEQSPVKNHFINVQAKIALSQCLLNQNRLAEAEQFALAAHAEARQNLGEQNPLVKTAAESLSKIYERQGKSK
jgi:serine/threonine-protein kinase